MILSPVSKAKQFFLDETMSQAEIDVKLAQKPPHNRLQKSFLWQTFVPKSSSGTEHTALHTIEELKTQEK